MPFFHEIRLDHFSHGFTAIGLVTLLIILLQALVQRFVGRDHIRRCHEVGGNYLSIVGTLYAVVLGLVVFDAMSSFDHAALTVKDESKSLLAVYMLADQAPSSETRAIKGLVRSYVDEVIDHEWELMADGKKSLAARKMALELIGVVKRINPTSENQKGIFPLLVQEALSIWENRRERTDESDGGIPNVEWVILLSGAVATILLTFFFAMDWQGLQYLMTALVTLSIAANLYLVLLFGSPYSGDLRVSDDSYRVVRAYIQQNP